MGGGDRRSSQPHPFHHDVTPSPSDREVSLVCSCKRGTIFALKIIHMCGNYQLIYVQLCLCVSLLLSNSLPQITHQSFLIVVPWMSGKNEQVTSKCSIVHQAFVWGIFLYWRWINFISRLFEQSYSIFKSLGNQHIDFIIERKCPVLVLRPFIITIFFFFFPGSTYLY